MEWCVQEGLLHVDSYLACRRRYEQDVIVSTLGGDGKRWRRLCTDTFAGADHRGKWVSFCLLSMISRVLARLAISRCSKHFENLGIVVNEQWVSDARGALMT